jgi:hypothetical protein
MKRKRVFTLLAGAMVLMLGGQLNSPIQRTSLQEQIAEKQRRGYSVKFLDNTLVELTEPMTGAKRTWCLLEPSEGEIREWAAQRGIPIMEIDPPTFDTTGNVGSFRYWTSVPVGMAGGGGELSIAGDVDHNGRPEIYGLHPPDRPFDPQFRVYEVDSFGNSTFRHMYMPYPGFPVGITDINGDSRVELVSWIYERATTFRFFTQPNLYSLPIDSMLNFPTTMSGGETIGFTPLFAFLDSDSAIDCLYRVAQYDSGSGFRIVAVAEYNSLSRTFVSTWSARVPPQGETPDYLGGLASVDFDQDGKQEFCTTTGINTPGLYVFESTGDDSFQLTYRYNTPLTGYYGVCAGDVDGDGKPEIFTEANMETDWVLVHEADSNDHFSPRLLIHFATASGFNVPTYFARDVDGDGTQELVLTTGPYILILKGDGDNRYRVWYLRREMYKETTQLFDLNRDGGMDLIVGKYGPDSLGRFRYFSDLYLNSVVSGLEEQKKLVETIEVLTSFPNPFNSETTIEYSIQKSQQVRLVIYDLKGCEVSRLVDGVENAGNHQIRFDSSQLASGIYFCQLETASSRLRRKLILMR